MVRFLFFSLIVVFLALKSNACRPDSLATFVEDNLAAKNELTVIGSETNPPYVYSEASSGFIKGDTTDVYHITKPGTQQLVIWEKGKKETCRYIPFEVYTKKSMLFQNKNPIKSGNQVIYKNIYKIKNN